MDKDGRQAPKSKHSVKPKVEANNVESGRAVQQQQPSNANVGHSSSSSNLVSSDSGHNIGAMMNNNNSDDEFEYATYDSDLELESTSNNDNQLPLIPTDFTSIQEAMQNMAAVFDSRYGAQHAPFYEGSLQDAIVDAFDAPGRGIEERRPLAIYLHNDNAVAAHIFAQTIMCSVEVSNLLKCQFVLWAWDVSQQQNRQSFFDWLGMANLSAVSDSIKLITPNKYPVLVVLIKERGQIARSTVIYGQDTVAVAVHKLMEGMDQYLMIKQQDSEEERNRMQREQFRQEQVEEYERGLAADRAKQEELKRKREADQEEERKRAHDEREKQKHRSALACTLPDEPAPDDPEAITVRLRFPNSESSARRFRASESVEMLLIYAETLGYDADHYNLWTSDRPKLKISALNTSKSFAELKWTKRELVTVEEK